MTGKGKKAKREGGLAVRPGWIVLDVSSASGGISYSRQELYKGGYGVAGSERRYETQRLVDHEVAVHDVEALVKEVDYLLRSTCVRTGFGWFADEERLTAVRKGLRELQAKAEAVNATAERLHSAARATIDIVSLPISVDPDCLATGEAARAISHTVRRALVEIRDLLRAGRTEKEDGKAPLINAMNKAKDLDQLATGVQATAIAFALERAASAKKKIREAVKAGRAPAVVGAEADLGALDSAIEMFTIDGEDGYAGIAAEVATAALKSAAED
jgi:hypothetical protein